MDTGHIVSTSLRIARGERGLWGFGLVSAAQGAIAAVLFGVVGALFAFVVAAGQALGMSSQSPDDPFSQLLTPDAIVGYLEYVRPWWPLAAAALGLLMTVWIVVAIYDVAATAGLVTETLELMRGDRPQFARGMRAGFSAWWRVAGLLAIGVIPTLAGLMVRALVVWFTVTVPLQSGNVPDGMAIVTGNQIATWVGNLMGLVQIPLSVLVFVGLRFALTAGTGPGESLSRAWHLAKGRGLSLALVYLFMMLIGVGLGLVMLVGIVVVGGVAGAVAFWLVTAGSVTAAVVIGAVAAAVCLALAGIVGAVASLIQSVAFTLWWHEATAHTPSPSVEGVLA